MASSQLPSFTNEHIIFTGPLSELISQIRIVVRDELNNIQFVESSPPKEYLNIQEAAAFLNVSVTTVYGYVSRQQIPSHKPGKHLFFKKEDLAEFINSGRQNSTKNIGKIAECIFLEANKKGGKI